MSTLETCFVHLKAKGRKALMPYLTLGWPQRDSALELIPALVEGGADVLELGIPFSDPLADGPVIQAASHRAIQNGMTVELALEQICGLKQRISLPPVVVMTYTNVLMNYGFERFAVDAAEAGVSGLIVPDLPPDHAGELKVALAESGIDMVFMVTPNLPSERIEEVAAQTSGFVYMVSVLGITGERNSMPDIEEFAARLRSCTTLPLALGFGISTPEQAKLAARQVDGVIVGSALIRHLGEHAGREVAAAREFCADFLREMRGDG